MYFTLGLNDTKGIRGDSGYKEEMGPQGFNGESGQNGNHILILSNCCVIN